MAFEKLVVVTRRTRLAELIERFNSRSQARFYLERAGCDFADYEKEDAVYRRALERLRRDLELGLKLQFVDRGYVPTFLFTDKDLIVTAGQDGLVANTAKYVGSQPIVAINPDPERFDGLLMRHSLDGARLSVERVLWGRHRLLPVTLAEARLGDGQSLLAFNDLFVGAASHVSARYRISLGQAAEPHSSSGVIVSTGAGSTGWLSSMFNMASGVLAFRGGKPVEPLRLDWSDPRLAFVVREPFASRTSACSLVAGLVEPGQELRFESLMPSGGVIFSDGVESDFLAFNSGAVARVAPAERKAQLVV